VSCCGGGGTFNGPDGGPFASGTTDVTSFGTQNTASWKTGTLTGLL